MLSNIRLVSFPRSDPSLIGEAGYVGPTIDQDSVVIFPRSRQVRRGKSALIGLLLNCCTSCQRSRKCFCHINLAACILSHILMYLIADRPLRRSSYFLTQGDRKKKVLAQGKAHHGRDSPVSNKVALILAIKYGLKCLIFFKFKTVEEGCRFLDILLVSVRR